MDRLLKYENNFLKIKHVKSKLISGNLNYNENPLVTIAIPTYKRYNLLKEALDSALTQIEFSDYEIIVVENSPDSDTDIEKLLRSYNNPKLLYYKNEENLGVAGNWNRCLELARGKWYVMLHDDDLLSNKFLKEMVGVLDKNPKISLLMPSHNHIDERDLPNKFNAYWVKLKLKRKLMSFEKKLRKLSEWDYILKNPVGGPVGIIMKRENAVKLGGFNEDHYPSFDYVFFTKYCVNYNTYFYNKSLGSYRISKNESLNEGVMITSAKIHFEMINELISKNIFKKLFFKKYPVYYVLKSVENTENFWGVSVKEDELKFLGKNKNLNPVWYSFYFMFKQIWQLKSILF